MSSLSSGKTSLVGKFLVTYVERLCLRFGKSNWTLCGLGVTKMKTKDSKTHKNRGAGFSGAGPEFPGAGFSGVEAGFSGGGGAETG